MLDKYLNVGEADAAIIFVLRRVCLAVPTRTDAWSRSLTLTSPVPQPETLNRTWHVHV